MSNLLNEQDFTSLVAERVSALGVDVMVPAPLSISLNYGEGEPVLTLRLESAYDEYKSDPDNVDIILLPLLTEVGWTVNGTRFSFGDIANHSLPLLRDLMRTPFGEKETQGEPGTSKGPVVYQELVNRPEERVVAQFVLAKNELLQPLHTGDMLRSYPEPNQFASIAVQNLRRLVSEIGLTLSEFPIENFGANPYMVSLRGNVFRQFIASMITVPDIMLTLEKTIKAEEGLVAILPARDKLIITADLDEQSVCEMGLLAKYLKDESEDPVSCFVWHFANGALKRVQTIELSEEQREEAVELNEEQPREAPPEGHPEESESTPEVAEPPPEDSKSGKAKKSKKPPKGAPPPPPPSFYD